MGTETPGFDLDIEIREATPADHATCAGILSRAWSSAMPGIRRVLTVEEFREQARDEHLLVAVGRGETVGFVSVWEPSWFVHHLFVDPAHQRLGVGRRLIGYVAGLAGAKPISLKCEVENRMALRFYERLGFRRTESTGRGEFGEWIELARSPSRGSDEPVGST